jgi:DnaJ-class molecular chaperone
MLFPTKQVCSPACARVLIHQQQQAPGTPATRAVLETHLVQRGKRAGNIVYDAPDAYEVCGGCDITFSHHVGPCPWCEGMGLTDAFSILGDNDAESVHMHATSCHWCGGSSVTIQCAGCGAMFIVSED